MRSSDKGACRRGRADRLFTEANVAWDKGDLEKAFALFARAAEMGDVSSQIDLGYFYDNGLFVKKDQSRAIKWYYKAYRQGDAGAANNIATVYRDLGETKKMLWWFRRAAELGDLDVLLELGRRYEAADGVPRNLSKAVDSYRRVVASRHATEDDKVKAESRLSALKCAKRAPARERGKGRTRIRG